MRVFSRPWGVFLFTSLLAISPALAQQRTIDENAAVSSDWRPDLDRQSAHPIPPAPPLPGVKGSIREPIHTGEHAVTALSAPGSPSGTTVVLPLSAGLSVVSLPLRVRSEKLSDIFPNLPEGSRAWVWDVSHQEFLEGLDNELPLGHACWLYVPVPALLAVSGTPNRLQDVAFDLEKGWNLIGVPYGTALLRSKQQVYVNWTRKSFNDAVAANELDPLIYSFDANGYETVAEDGFFQPLHGYWVYASGAELLELKNPALSAGIIDMIPWGTIASTGFGMIMTQMGYSDTAKLNQTLSKLDGINQSLTALDAKLDAVLASIELSKTEVLQSIGDSTYVSPVQVALLSHFDQQNPNTSFAWFVAQAKAGTGQSVPMTTKSDFARKVLNDWKFIDQFNSIKAGILPMSASYSGLLDNFGDNVVLTSNKYDLTNHYEAMETYFSTLLGMQIKCATLIMNAYDQLAHDPASSDGYTAQTAAEWKASVFDPTIKAETERFLQAVEGVSVKKVPIPQTWTDAPVNVPDYVQVMLGMADSYVMQTLQEPAGIRFRIMLNPSGGTDVPIVAWASTGSLACLIPQSKALPSFDTWNTYTGAGDYDDWIVQPDSNTRAFKVTSSWKVARTVLPLCSTGKVAITAMGSSVWWRNNVVSAVVSPDASGFGSFTSARRPTTSDVFSPCLGWPVSIEATQYCWSSWGQTDCDQKSTKSCNSYSFHPAGSGAQSMLTVNYEFKYLGSSPKTGTWKANLNDGFTTNARCGSTRYEFELYQGNPYTSLNMTYRHQDLFQDPVTLQSVQVTWNPGQTYAFQIRMKPEGQSSDMGCLFNWGFNGAQMTFP